MNDHGKQRVAELLIDRATDSLTVVEQQELASLLTQLKASDERSYDELVANMQVTVIESDMKQLPKHLRNQVIDQAQPFVSPDAVHSEVKPETRTVTAGSYRREMLAWLATSACLALAAFLWFQPDRSDSQIVQNTSLIAVSSEKALNEFIAGKGNENVFKVSLGSGNHDSGKDCQASVVWDRKLKRGFLTVNNLATNEPTVEQYQLWIIDKKRGDEDRPNAGVFDISKPGVNVFEFRSELPIFEAQGFAVTVEKSGGVAVSDLSKISLANLGTE